MNGIHILQYGVLALAVTACATRRASFDEPSPVASTSGTLPRSSVFTLDVGASRVRLFVEERDSVSWALHTSPAGCATAATSDGRLGLAHRDRECTTRWEVRVPVIDDVRVTASVGDIELSAPADRALRLRTRVGSVRFTLDGRELRHARSAGSGDQLDFGDLGTLPRLEVRTNVGSITATMRTATARPPR